MRGIPAAISSQAAIVVAKDCTCPITLDNVISLVWLMYPLECPFPMILNPVDLYFLSFIKLHKAKENGEDTVKDMNVER